MRNPTRWRLLLAVGATIALILLVLGWNGNGLRFLVALELSRAVGRPVTVSGAGVDLTADPVVTGRDVIIAGSGSEAAATATSVSARLDRSALLHGRVHVLTLTMDHPDITVSRDSSGAWNWSMPDFSGGPVIDQVVIEGGRLHVDDPARKTDLRMTLAADGKTPLSANVTGTYEALPIKARVAGRYADRVLRLAPLTGTIGTSDIAGSITLSLQGERLGIAADLASNSASMSDLAAVSGVGSLRSGGARVISDLPIDLGALSSLDATLSYRAARITTGAAPLRSGVVRFTLAKGRLDVTALDAEVEGGRVTASVTLEAGPRVPHAVASLKFHAIDLKHFVPSDRALQDTGRFTGEARLDATGGSLAQMLGQGQGTIKFTMSEGDLSAFLTHLPGVDLTDPVFTALHLRTPTPIRCAAGEFALDKGALASRVLVIDTSQGTFLGSGSIDMRSEAIAYRIAPAPTTLPIASLQSPIEIKGTLRRPTVAPASDVPPPSGLAAALSAVLGPVEALIGTAQNSLGSDQACADTLRSEGAR